MDRFNAMRIFTRIVELGSFTKAADDLHMPAATATYTIKQLEAHLGTRLLQRTTRHVSTTLDGDAYYQRCVRILADVEETEAGFGNSGALPRGKLRVDLQGTLARHYVLPRLAEFFARYPDIELEIGMGDRLVDLVREGMDSCCAWASWPIQAWWRGAWRRWNRSPAPAPSIWSGMARRSRWPICSSTAR